MIRRQFIKASTLVAGSIVAPISLKAADEKIKMGIVGTGWWGTEFLLTHALLSKQFDIVGLCDVNEVALNNAAKQVEEAGEPKPQLFASYKDLYKISGLEAVVIATPTHWHALQFIDACNQGLHVFLEKPISYDICEGKAMMEAHQKAKNIVQVDFPRLMVDTNDQVKAYINSGEAGEIRQIKANINTGGGSGVVEKDIPETIDYETFCGPAPKVKYMCAPKGNKPQWRAQTNFNRGILFDWGIHYIHNARKVLDLGLPNYVSAIGGITQNSLAENPDHLDVRFDFDGLPVYWSHKEWGFTSPTPENNIGVYYYGTKATIFAGDLGWKVYPKGDGEMITHGDARFRPGAPENQEIMKKIFVDLFIEFATGIRTNSNENITNKLEDGQLTTACVTYGDLACITGARLSVESSSMNITNNEDAQQMLFRDYRSPYKHPYQGRS